MQSGAEPKLLHIRLAVEKLFRYRLRVFREVLTAAQPPPAIHRVSVRAAGRASCGIGSLMVGGSCKAIYK